MPLLSCLGVESTPGPEAFAAVSKAVCLKTAARLGLTPAGGFVCLVTAVTLLSLSVTSPHSGDIVDDFGFWMLSRLTLHAPGNGALGA